MTFNPNPFFSFLQQPAMAVNAKALCDYFAFSTLHFTCKMPLHLSEIPDLNLRLRGALGRALADYGPLTKGRADAFQRPLPFDVFYSEIGDYRAGHPIPKPIAIRGDVAGAILTIKIHILGGARLYADAVAAAMFSALTGGISFSDNARERYPIEVLDFKRQENASLSPPISASSIVMKFSSPYVVRARDALSLSDQAFVNSLINRVEGLSRWLDVELKKITDMPAISLSMEELTHISWSRHSIRQRDRSIPIEGFLGRLKISGHCELLLPFLQIGEIFGIGSRASLGLGAYDLIVYP